MLSKLKRAVEVLGEAWFVARVPPNEGIFRGLSIVGRDQGGREHARGFCRYLEDYPLLGRIAVEKDWAYEERSGEMRLTYSNSLFASGCLRLISGRKEDAVLVFLPGYHVGSNEVLGAGKHPQNMRQVASILGMGIVCWDWPLQGWRRDRCLYRGLRSVYSGEREYSRILPALGTSLWRELVGELQFALEQVRRYVGAERAMHVAGWSMGGCFAYLAPLLGTNITTTIAAGSCARVKDLLAEGRTRTHGYFFYPLNGLAYFDLDDLVEEILRRQHALLVIHGERDGGCLESTRRSLTERAAELGRPLLMEVLPGHRHIFSGTIKRRIIEFLSEYNSKTN